MAAICSCRYCNVTICDATRCDDCTAVLADAQERGETLTTAEVAARAMSRRATRVTCQTSANVRKLSSIAIKLPSLPPAPQPSFGMRPNFLTQGRVRHAVT